MDRTENSSPRPPNDTPPSSPRSGKILVVILVVTVSVLSGIIVSTRLWQVTGWEAAATKGEASASAAGSASAAPKAPPSAGH